MITHKRLAGLSIVFLILLLVTFLGGYLVAPRPASAKQSSSLTLYSATYDFPGGTSFTCAQTQQADIGYGPDPVCVVSAIAIPQQPTVLSVMSQDPVTGQWRANTIQGLGDGEFGLEWNNGTLELLVDVGAMCFVHYNPPTCSPANILYSAVAA